MIPVPPVIGPIPELIATLKALEVLQLILALGHSSAGRLLSFNGETTAFGYFDI